MKTRLKFTLVTALAFILLSVFFLIPSFAEDTVSVSFLNRERYDYKVDDAYVSDNPSYISLESVHVIKCENIDNGGYYYVMYDSSRLSTDRNNPTVIPYSSDISFYCDTSTFDDDPCYCYFIIESPPPTPTPEPNIWNTIGDTTGGIFQVGTSILNGILANDTIAFFVIAIPIFGVLVAIVFGIVGIAKNRKKKKNNKR